MKKACVFALDDAYVMPFQVFFDSLEKTKSIPDDVEILILHTSTLPKASISAISAFLDKYKKTAVFHDVSNLIPEKLPIKVGSFYSDATFYRLFLELIIPIEYDHIVYLDCDMVALKSIAELFTIQLAKPIAAVDHLSFFHCLRLWGENSGSYFQGGVLVISVDAWRRLSMEKKFMEIMSNDWDRIQFVDQDILNLAFENEWQRLPVWYNIDICGLGVLGVDKVIQNAKLIHFSGANKPWNTFNPSPFTSTWDVHYQQAIGYPFPRDELKKKSKTTVLNRLINKFNKLPLNLWPFQ